MNGEDHSDLGNPIDFPRFFHRRLGPFPRKEDVKAMEGDMWSKLVTADEANDLIVVNFEFKGALGGYFFSFVFFFSFFPAENRKTSQWMQGMASHCIFFQHFPAENAKIFLPGVNAKGRPLYGTRPDGLMPRHVYSVLRAVEVPGEIWEEPKRMVCLRNPWGRCEWQGPWKDQGAVAPDFG
jgi:hypothetical protein